MIPISPFLLGLLLLLVATSFYAFNNTGVFNQLKFNIASVKQGEYYRLITAGFIHVDRQHLLFNGFTLYFFGDTTLHGLGIFNFSILYLFSLLAGNLFANYFHRNEPYYSAVGASGAIMGVVYSSILMFPEMKLAFIFLPIPMPAYVFGVGYLVYTLFGMKRQADTIGHTAHFGGAIGGVVCTLIFNPSVIEKSLFTLVLLSIVTVVLAFILFWRKV